MSPVHSLLDNIFYLAAREPNLSYSTMYEIFEDVNIIICIDTRSIHITEFNKIITKLLHNCRYLS